MNAIVISTLATLGTSFGTNDLTCKLGEEIEEDVETDSTLVFDHSVL